MPPVAVRDGDAAASGSAAAPPSNPSASSLHKIKSRHVQLVDDANNLRERQWTTAGVGGRTPRPSPMVRSPSGYSIRPTYSRTQSSGARTPIDPHSPRASISTFHLQRLLETLEIDQYDTFGMEELRDGFFDATFYRSSTQQGLDDEYEEEDDSGFGVQLGRVFADVIRVQIEDSNYFFTAALGTHDGILLLKACLGYFIAYILCLIPKTKAMLGEYSYWVTIAALFNHAGRTVGAQIDGTIGCIVGGAVGLGFGCLALEVAGLKPASSEVHGAIMLAFLVPIFAALSWIRCSFLRFYQANITAGLALIFLCLVEPHAVARGGGWRHSTVQGFAIPWLVGLGICLVVNVCLYPETGGRVVAYEHPIYRTALHNAIKSALQALVLPREYSLEIHSNMSQQLVNLSNAVRDMRNEITFTAIIPDNAEQLRNLLQDVIRQIMAIKPESSLFDHELREPNEDKEPPEDSDVVIQIQSNRPISSMSLASSDYENPLEIVRNTVGGPARELIIAMTEALRCCDNALMRIARLPDLFDREESFDVQLSRAKLKAALEVFDDADLRLIDHPDMPSSYSSHPDLVQLFLFINPLRQAAVAIDSLVTKALQISQKPASNTRQLFWPSYPIGRAVYRTNPQVRHDRGGVSAGYYFRLKDEINGIMNKIQSRAYHPDAPAASNDRKGSDRPVGVADPETFRYRTWKVLHRLQQFESRFAVRVLLATGSLSAPAWLRRSTDWWTEYQAWWAVVAVWLMMHPRVGGNAQDLVTRTIATVIGAVWGGLAYAAGSAAGSKASPYILAVFAAVFMIPAVFRFMLSSHPRSGLMACLSFTVVSLSAQSYDGRSSPSEIAWSRGMALATGVVAAVIINWIVWPFIARHELRKSLSFMLLSLGIAYRGVVARYIYHDSDYHPTAEDIEMSEIQEAKLREHCFRMRELADMTRHEIRPRGPFDPAPYSDAIDACERFLEQIIEVRQASLYFQPFLSQGSEDATQKMLSPRRDAVANILMNLYVLAGSLRSKRPVPRYLPSAAAARKRLLDRMAEVEIEYEDERLVRPRSERTRRWADVYHYAYAAALTDIVAQVELLERLTKVIVGEMALDVPSWQRSGI